MKSYRQLERFFLIAGLALLMGSIIVRVHGLVMARAEVWSFEANQSKPPTVNSAGEKPESSSINFALWSEKRIRAYEAALGMKMDAPLAVLTIPRARIEVPVFDGTDELILNRGAGRIAGTAMPGEPGNIGIAAHRDGFFRGLKEVHVGDNIELAANGDDFLYKVDDIQIVQPSDVSVLQSGSHSSLTLVTCYPFYFVGDAPQRYIVHASMVDSDKTATSGSDSAVQKVRKEHTQ
ncbi:MAG TPA: class D sortase [Silvibacterium sp.]|jgi:sortase A|nr:class D sortase [Silvibacterium sp.]